MYSIKLYRRLQELGYDIGRPKFGVSITVMKGSPFHVNYLILFALIGKLCPWTSLLLNLLLSGFKQSGSVNLAQTKDRLIALKRRMAYHQATGLHCEVLITLT
jgi:hypothetical protein